MYNVHKTNNKTNNQKLQPKTSRSTLWHSITPMPAQPTDPQPTANDRVPRKRQARLDDNGEPAGVPALKKMKSVEKNGQIKKVPVKTRPEKKTAAPLKKTPSAEITTTQPASDSNGTNPPETVVVVSSDDEDAVVEIPEEPEEEAEAQLGAYSNLLSNKKN
jgi:hypothetical protein